MRRIVAEILGTVGLWLYGLSDRIHPIFEEDA